MTIRDYYRHARACGNFRAIDCLNLARQAFALDEANYVTIPPMTAGVEVLPDGTAPIILSFGIKVF